MKFYQIITSLVTVIILSSCGYSGALGGSSTSKKRSSSTSKIYFEDAKMEKVQGLAVDEIKPIFIDFYTDWCAPCKWLEKDAFETELAASYFNKNLVNKKINAEKGEGIELAQKHSVRAFPTMIFLRPNGQEISRHVGMTTASDLVVMAKKAVQVLETERRAAEAKKKK
jgi:thiol:disulfide interchange protein